MTTYKIVRFRRTSNGRPRTILRGLTLEQAQLHCRSELTHKLDKNGNVVWFDGYTQE